MGLNKVFLMKLVSIPRLKLLMAVAQVLPLWDKEKKNS